MNKKMELKNCYYSVLKHRRMANKLKLNSEDKMLLKTELYSWILGIIEDDPLPKEIEYIVFNFDFRNHSVNLSLSGHENLPKCIYDGSYFPLEAQFFNCELLNVYFNNNRNLNGKNQLFEYKKEELFSHFENMLKYIQKNDEFNFFDNKRIIIGEYLKEKSKSFVFHSQ